MDFCQRLVWVLFLVVLFPIDGDMTSPTGMHMQAGLSPPPTHSGRRYSMPFRNIWLAAMSMTLMMNAMAKAQMRLFLTHVWRFFFEGWTEETGGKTKKRINKTFLKGQFKRW